VAISIIWVSWHIARKTAVIPAILGKFVTRLNHRSIPCHAGLSLVGSLSQKFYILVLGNLSASDYWIIFSTMLAVTRLQVGAKPFMGINELTGTKPDR
jgi:hypothetical protein